MKFKRLFLTSITALCLLTSCNVAKESKPENNGDGIVHLDIAQANLISEITGNEDYLNKNLLKKVQKLNDNDTVGAIITLDGMSVMDKYLMDKKGCENVREFIEKGYADFDIATMQIEQKRLINKLHKEGLIDESKHSYTTVMNGFSVETTYGNYKKLLNMGFASKISLSEVYAKPQQMPTSSNDDGVTENVVDVYETGIFNASAANSRGYDGTNTAVAILDSGFDVHHQVFKNMPDPNHLMIEKDDVKRELPNMSASGFTKGLKVEDVYINTKIPYAYDYADKDEDVAPFESSHGTHVAGIIAGKDEKITGVAINTQLVLMKVFGDVSSGATDEDIIAALDDSIKLGVDAINLSLGTACGFTEAHKDSLRNIYRSIEEAGISLIVAASNDYSSGYGGAESNTPKASNPDSAVVGSPATYNASLAVASIAGEKSKYIKTVDGYTFYFEEANGKGANNYDFYEMLGIEKGKNIEIDYVTVPGVGKPANYSSINVNGKIALVKRGGISFEEKAQYAYEAGAVGCILYNNTGGEILMNAGSHLKIAYASISKDDGEYLAAKKTGKLVFNTNNQAGPYMSDFSSWGPSPDLKLKPEITAHGGEILSSVPGGGYDKISGTSMASPNMCGIVVLIRQYLKKDYNITDPVELSKLTNQILMSTATIANDKYGNPYAPRKQGAGLGNLKNALDTKAYLTVDGINKPKIELGDDPKQNGVYTLKFNIHNLSNDTLSYRLSNKTMTETLQSSDRRFIAQRGYMLNPDTKAFVDGNGSLNGDVITVDAKGTVSVSYTLTLNNADKRYMRQGFKNGIYVEGFATLDNMDAAGVDLSIPFLAFFGDWTKSPMFDKTIFEVESTKYNAAIDEEDKIKADYYATQPLARYFTDFIIPMGAYIYEMDTTKYDQIPIQEEHCALGYGLDTMNGIMTIYAGLLRNAKQVRTTITNVATGDIVYTHVNHDQLKAHFSGMQIPSFDMIEVIAAEQGFENNVKYKFRMEADLDYGDGGRDTNTRNVFEFSFYCDTAKPLIKDAQFYAEYDKIKKENRYYVDLYIYDNHYAQSIRPFIFKDGKTPEDGSMSFLSEYPIPVYGDKNSVSKVKIEVTDYMDYLQYNSIGSGENKVSITNGLGFLVDDYALNSNCYFVSLPGTNATDLEFRDEKGNKLTSLNIEVGEELDVLPFLYTDDPRFNKDSVGALDFLSKCNWISSDEKVFKVKNGKIQGVGFGKAELTVRTINDANASEGMFTFAEETITIRVKESSSSRSLTSLMSTSYAKKPSIKNIDFTYFDTVSSFIDGPEYSKLGKPGNRIFVTNMPTVEFYPSEQIRLHHEIKPWNYEVDPKNLIYSSSNENVASVDETGLVTALKEGSSTITLKVKGSNQLAKIKVVVKNEFIIQNRFLVGYKGFGGDVVIPDDKGILGIQSYAFSLYTLDTKIDVDEDDPDGNKVPGSNKTIKSVTIPADVSELGKYAFYNCEALETVNFLSKPNGEKLDTCSIIRQFAFTNCKSLKNINLENVTVIGESAFENCTSLKELNLKKIYALGVRAFKGCTGLEKLDLTHLRNAGIEVFKDCTNLKEIVTGEFTKYSEGMFENSGLESLEFKSDRIPDRAFKNCKNLKVVNIVNDIIYVGNEAFMNNENLNIVTFAKGCDFIYRDAFKNSGITKIVLPNSKVEFEYGILSGCPNLKEVEFKKLTEIVDIRSDIFSGSDKVTFKVPEDGNYKYENSILYNKDKTVIILASHTLDSDNFIIPDGVIEIADSAFNGINGLRGLTLTNNLEKVGRYAFASCVNLKTVKGSHDGILYEDGAFAKCSLLDSFEGLENMTIIYPYMFANTGFKNIIINPAVIGEGAFMASNLESVNGTGLDRSEGKGALIGAKAFMNCSMLNEFKLANASIVGDEAFRNDQMLSHEKLDQTSFTSIGAYAFYGALNMTSVDMPNVIEVKNNAFMFIPQLRNVNLPMVKYVGDYAFTTDRDRATHANEVKIYTMPNVEYIGHHAFEKNKKLQSFETNGAVSFIGDYAFGECTSIKSIKMPNAIVKVINEGAFAKNIFLETLVLNNIEVVEDGAFFEDEELLSFDFHQVKSVGVQAFFYNEKLTSLNLDKLETASSAAFMGCSSVTTLNIPVLKIADYQAFSGIKVEEIIIPSCIEKINPLAFDSIKTLVRFTNEAGDDTCIINNYARIHEGVLYTKYENTEKLLLTAYPINKPEEEYSVLNGTVRIGYYAAAQARNLRKVILPETLKLIGNMAFYQANLLKTVEFHSTTAPILEETFHNTNIVYRKGTEIYDLVNKFINIYKPTPLYYAQFVNIIGFGNKLNIIIPANETVNGYDNVVYNLYFNEPTKLANETLDHFTLSFLELAAKLPTDEVTLQDKDLIVNARTTYNKMKQDFTKLNYSEAALKALTDKINKEIKKLEDCEEKLETIKVLKAKTEYGDLIDDIYKLGADFEYDKINEYKRIANIVEEITDDEKKISIISDALGIFESFKKQYSDYFNNLNEDIIGMDNVTELPTSPVNNTARTVSLVSTILLTLTNLAGLVLSKRWLI